MRIASVRQGPKLFSLPGLLVFPCPHVDIEKVEVRESKRVQAVTELENLDISPQPRGVEFSHPIPVSEVFCHDDEGTSYVPFEGVVKD